jgi:hypothetical protein
MKREDNSRESSSKVELNIQIYIINGTVSTSLCSKVSFDISFYWNSEALLLFTL